MLDDEVGLYIRFCRENAIHTLATSYIFEKRSEKLKKWLTWINYVGFAVPLLAGLMLLSFDLASWGLVKIIAGIILLPQALLNLYAIVNKWVDAQPYAIT